MNKKQKALAAALEAKEQERIAAAAHYDPADADFEVIGPDVNSREAIARPSVSFWQDAMRRLFSEQDGDCVHDCHCADCADRRFSSPL